MKNLYFLLLAALVATSCTKYNISGSSDLNGVDGRMLYLKAIAEDKIQNIDSCDVVHGKFEFSGALDSIRVVMLCTENEGIMPVVLEDGKIEVTLNSGVQECKGTPLNDSLSLFNNRYRQIVMQLEDLTHQQNRAIMDGEDMDVVNAKLMQKQRELMMQEDRLISSFIAENFENCLGPYVFQLATEAYEYPVLAPWIEALMSKATDTFKNNRYVADYLEAAKHNQDIMTGVVDVPQQIPNNSMAADVPTPNQLAEPGE